MSDRKEPDERVERSEEPEPRAAKKTTAEPAKLGVTRHQGKARSVEPVPAAATTLGTQKEPEEAMTDWDQSMLVMEAVKLGIPQDVYQQYLAIAYGDPMSDFDIHSQQQALLSAKREPKSAVIFKQTVELTVRKKGAAK